MLVDEVRRIDGSRRQLERRRSCRPIERAFSAARRDCQLPRLTKSAQAIAAAARPQPRGRKEYPRSMRYVVIGMLVLIVASLFSALVFV